MCMLESQGLQFRLVYQQLLSVYLCSKGVSARILAWVVAHDAVWIPLRIIEQHCTALEG